jgi:hypothetical protein
MTRRLIISSMMTQSGRIAGVPEQIYEPGLAGRLTIKTCLISFTQPKQAAKR